MASTVNINIDQGASFALQITLSDEQGNLIDVSQYAFTAMLRQNYNRDPVAEFHIAVTDHLNSQIEMSLTPIQTSALKGGVYVWDIIGLLGNGDVARIAQGQAEVIEGVTNYTFSTSNAVIARSAYVGREVGNVMALGGFPPSYYLDYTNFTNVPTSLTDFGLVDGAEGTVLTTDGNGNFTFEPTVHDAILFNGLPADYYLDYTNFTNVPTQLQQFNVADGAANEVLVTDGNGSWYFTSLDSLSTVTNVDADTLGGQLPSYYLTYSNLIGAPTSIDAFGITDGTNGQVLTTDGNGNYTFQSLASNATTLGGQGPGYYIDYNNLINTPTVPTDIFDLGISDSTNGYVLTTDGVGNVSFQAVPTDADTLDGLDGSYYLNYNNLWNKPVQINQSSQLSWDGANGQMLISNGNGTYRWEFPSTDADTLDGKDSSYFINYNNLQNKPTIPFDLLDLNIADGNPGQVLTTNGNGAFYWTTYSLDGKNGAYYLDYNNFTNKPVVPNKLAQMIDIVNPTTAAAGQVLTYNGGSSYSFQTVLHDAYTFNNELPSYYLDYDNLDNKPYIPLRFLDLLDMQDGNPGQVLTTNGAGVIRFADPQGAASGGTVGNATTLGGQTGAFYLDYNNFTNKPFIPTDINQLADASLLLNHFSGNYNDLTNKPVVESGSNYSMVAPNYVIIDSAGNGQIEIGRNSGVGAVVIGSAVTPTVVYSNSIKLGMSASAVTTFQGSTVGINYNDLTNKPNIVVATGQTWNSNNGVLQTNFSDSTATNVNLDGRYVRSVNGITGDINGNIAVSLTTTEVGTEAERAAATPSDGVIWVVTGDVDPANDGRTYIYNATNAQWYESATFNQAQADARYVQLSDTIDSLSDVDTSTAAPTDGQTLVWDGTASQWVPGTPSTVGAIDDLTDVDTTTAAPTDGQTLVWDSTSSNWVPGSTSSSTFETETTVATAGQTNISLSQIPVGSVHLTRNGSSLPADSFTVLGQIVTYVPANNNNEPLEAGDVITVSYINAEGPDYTPTNVISDNTDVDTSGAVDGDALVYDLANGVWKPGQVAGGSSVGALDDLTDVDVSTTPPTDGQALVYDATNSEWIPGDAAAFPQAEYATFLFDSNKGIAINTTDDYHTFTLPTAGTYEITYSLRIVLSGTSRLATAEIKRGADQFVYDESLALCVNADSTETVGDVDTTTRSIIVTTTTDNEDFILFVQANGGTATVVNNSAGKSNLFYKKISGFLPVTDPLAAEYGYALFSPRENFVANSYITSTNQIVNQNLSIAGGMVTLKAGVTYELEASIVMDSAAVSSSAIVYRWRDTTGIEHGNIGVLYSPNYNSDGTNQPTAKAIITPTSDMTIGVYCGYEAANTATRADYGYMWVKAIAGQLPVTTSPSPENAIGFLPVGTASTPIGMTLNDDEYLEINLIGVSSFPYGNAKVIKIGGACYTEYASASDTSATIRIGGGATVSVDLGYGAFLSIDAAGVVSLSCTDGRAGSELRYVAIKY